MAFAAVLSTIAVAFVTAVLWLYRINKAIKAIPEPAAKAAPRRWTTQEIRDMYEKLEEKPVDFGKHLPPRLERRYVVVGGSGMLLLSLRQGHVTHLS